MNDSIRYLQNNPNLVDPAQACSPSQEYMPLSEKKMKVTVGRYRNGSDGSNAQTKVPASATKATSNMQIVSNSALPVKRRLSGVAI